MRLIELTALAEKAVKGMHIPASNRDLYPRIHATAYAIDWPNKAEALGAVFEVICNAVGVVYGSQYMDRLLTVKLADGSFEKGIKAIKGEDQK